MQSSRDSLMAGSDGSPDIDNRRRSVWDMEVRSHISSGCSACELTASHRQRSKLASPLVPRRHLYLRCRPTSNRPSAHRLSCEARLPTARWVVALTNRPTRHLKATAALSSALARSSSDGRARADRKRAQRATCRPTLVLVPTLSVTSPTLPYSSSTRPRQWSAMETAAAHTALALQRPRRSRRAPCSALTLPPLA